MVVGLEGHEADGVTARRDRDVITNKSNGLHPVLVTVTSFIVAHSPTMSEASYDRNVSLADRQIWRELESDLSAQSFR